MQQLDWFMIISFAATITILVAVMFIVSVIAASFKRRRPLPSTAIKTERIKLMANWFNTMASAIMTAGVFGPLFAYVYGFAPNGVNWQLILYGGLGCMVASIALHQFGRMVLGGLE